MDLGRHLQGAYKILQLLSMECPLEVIKYFISQESAVIKNHIISQTMQYIIAFPPSFEKKLFQQ